MTGGGEALVAGFLNGLARQRVVDFIRAVVEDEALMQELSAVDLKPEAVATFACQKGYVFSGDDLTDVIESRIAQEVPESEQALRRQLQLEREARGSSGRVPLHIETDAALLDIDHAPDFVLDRASILRGNVAAIRGMPALPDLLTFMSDALEHAFDAVDLEQIHLHYDFKSMKARAETAYVQLLADDRIPTAMASIVRDLGMDPDDVLWEWPGMRILFPVEQGGRGMYRTANSGALAAHRDTWYGSPQHQINFWGPIRRLDPDATLRIYARYFGKTVPNSSYGYDTWQNQCGLALAPSIQCNASAEGAFAPPLGIGDALCFSGHQLHASAVNRSGRTRLSFEFRLLHRNDEGREGVPANTDYDGIGEIYHGWYDQNGQRINRLTGKHDTV